MQEHQVNCINKPHHNSPHEHITHIGNTVQKWRITRDTAIVQIDSKTTQYFTIDKTNGKKCYVGVVREPGKNPYLRTHADGKWNDNLLAQTECNGSCNLVG